MASRHTTEKRRRQQPSMPLGTAGNVGGQLPYGISSFRAMRRLAIIGGIVGLGLLLLVQVLGLWLGFDLLEVRFLAFEP